MTQCIDYNDEGIESYWFADFLRGDNGHDYCIVFVNANVYPQILTLISLINIMAKMYYGHDRLLDQGRRRGLRLEQLRDAALGHADLVVPEPSKTWFDIQWGPVYAYDSWDSFTFVLDNGVKIVTMTTGGLNGTGYADSIITFGYLDGHIVETDYHPSSLWVSAISDITYHSNYQIHVPGKAWFGVNLPVQSGELIHYDDPSPVDSISDSFAYYFDCHLDGEHFQGVGVARRNVVHFNDGPSLNF
ncbi:MAG: hypothetical protein M1818_002722 [Claussenomyces sp. TS43310]|nr:MAG: hypothetical protein M1818_002722 [Claussenomyces sp. TS43310]